MLSAEDWRTQEKGCFCTMMPGSWEGSGQCVLAVGGGVSTDGGWKHLGACSRTFGPTAVSAAVCSEIRGPLTWALRPASPCGLSFLTAWRPPGSQPLALVAQAPNVSECCGNCTTLPGAPWEVKQNNPHCLLVLKSKCQGTKSGHCPLAGGLAGTPGMAVRPPEPFSESVSPERVTPFLIQGRAHLCLLCESPPNSHP